MCLQDIGRLEVELGRPSDPWHITLEKARDSIQEDLKQEGNVNICLIPLISSQMHHTAYPCN